MSLMRQYKQRPVGILREALEEVARLFEEAAAFRKRGEQELARRRVRAARRKAMKVQLRIPEFRERYCRACDAYLELGANATVRIKNGMRILTCNECGAARRRKVK